MSAHPPPPGPPEGPTEPLLAPRPPIVAERVVAPAAVVPGGLEGAIASLRTGLAIVGVLAVAALAVAVYALVNNDGATGHGRYASSARVSEISRRVDSLSAQVRSTRTGAPAAAPAAPAAAGSGATAALSGRVDALERSVATLTARPQPADPSRTLAQLSTRVDTLANDVAQLKQSRTQTPTTP